jgi:REP element-mobilizing transposase RayT
MDRYWLLTWTTYGTWLPGDRRGFVSNVREGDGPELRHNLPGTPYDADLLSLQNAAHQLLKGTPIYLGQEQADTLRPQFQETAAYRGWLLVALAIMAGHVHLVVGVAGDPDPSKMLQDFKSYGSRALNRRWAKPLSGTWWTESGSTRKLHDETAVGSAVQYVRNQPNALVVWIAEGGERGRQPLMSVLQRESLSCIDNRCPECSSASGG